MSVRAAAAVAWVETQFGKPYDFGGEDTNVAWDCSSLMREAYRRVGVLMPRTARDQLAWLDGNYPTAGASAPRGTKVSWGAERPGDLIFWDSYRGDTEVGHVVMVKDPARQMTVETTATDRDNQGRTGCGSYFYGDQPSARVIFEIRRLNP